MIIIIEILLVIKIGNRESIENVIMIKIIDIIIEEYSKAPRNLGFIV